MGSESASVICASRQRREAQSRAGAGRRAIARHVFEPVEIEMLGGAGERHPVEDLGRAGVEFIAWQVAQEVRVLVCDRLEDGAVEVLVDQEVAQATRREHADLYVAGES